MQIKSLRWTEHPFPCFHCGENVAEWETIIDYHGITINQCICNVCANLPDVIILEKALHERRTK